MVHQKCSYLKLKGQTYYFSRRVPKRIQKHFKTDRVEVCLYTTLESSARRQSQVLANELEDHWYILRRREMKDRLSNVFGGFEFGQGAALAQMGKGPMLSQALRPDKNGRRKRRDSVSEHLLDSSENSTIWFIRE